MARLTLDGVTKSFGAFRALDDVSLEVANGEFMAILGASGCGKTTLLRQIAGFDKLDAGRILIGDSVVSTVQRHVPPERRRIGIVFQSYALWPHMSVAENVAYGLTVAGVKDPERARRVAAALTLVELDGFADRRPGLLSGGQRQRVALARCLVTEPSLVLLDEPLANLDVNLRASMEDEFARFHARTATTMIYVTHDQAEAMVIADRIAVMNKGVIEQTGSPQEIYERPRSRFVASFMGGANCLPASVLGPGIVRCGDVQVRAADPEGFRPGDEVVLCIRPHAVRVHRARNGVPRGENLASGRLLQQAYLGDFHDLRIALSGGAEVRALTPAGLAYDGGEEVLVELPAHACRLLHT